MAGPSVVGIFETLNQAESVVQQLTAVGITTGQTSVTANNLQSARTARGHVQRGVGRGWCGNTAPFVRPLLSHQRDDPRRRSDDRGALPPEARVQ